MKHQLGIVPIWSYRWALNSAEYYGQSHYGEYTTNDRNSNGNYVKINDYTIEAEKSRDGDAGDYRRFCP